MQRVDKYNKKKGRQTGEEYKKRARFNLFITNITEGMLDVEVIVKIYRIRWQIELIFKTWKSVFGLDNIGQMKYERLICILNTRLLLILVNWEMFMVERAYQYKQTGKLLSIHKCLQTLKDNSAKLRNILTSGCKGLAKWFRWVVETLSSKHWLEKKKNKLGFEEILCLTIL
jgi:IS4 transposase